MLLHVRFHVLIVRNWQLGQQTENSLTISGLYEDMSSVEEITWDSLRQTPPPGVQDNFDITTTTDSRSVVREVYLQWNCGAEAQVVKNAKI